MNRVASESKRGVEIKVVGRSGQISLGKSYAGKTFRLERLTEGRIVLTAVAMVPESQLWTLANRIARELNGAFAGPDKRSPARPTLTPY